MKIAVATQKGGLEDRVSQIVGRAPTFTIVETSNGEIVGSEVLQNEFSQAQSGAGVQAAQTLVNEGIDAIIGGNFGPNLANVFTRSEIGMYQASEIAVEEAVYNLLEGKLSQANGPTGQAGRGTGRGMGKGKGGQGGGSQSGRGQGGGMGSNQGRV